MKFEHVQSYDSDPTTVFAILSDPDYVEAKCWATGATEAGVDVSHDGDQLIIRSARTLPAKVPSYAKSFVGDALETDQTETWNPASSDGSRDGIVELTFSGTPLKVAGTMRLEASENGSTVSTSGTIKAGVPMIGGKIERFAAKEIARGLDAEAKAANKRLS